MQTVLIEVKHRMNWQPTEPINVTGTPYLSKVQESWEYLVDNYSDEDEIFLPVIVAWFLFFVTYWTCKTQVTL